MNAGNTRATATVARCVGDEHEVRLYSVWCARVLAMIGRPPSTIRDRSIPIELRRRTASEPVDRLRADRLHDDLAPIRSRWRRWADDHLDALRAADPDVPTRLHDRAADCWRPLIAIADLAGGDWPAHARAAAGELSGGEPEDGEALTELLADVREYLTDHDAEIIPSDDLRAWLIGRADRPWATWRKGQFPITERGIARILAPVDVRPSERVSRVDRRRGYRRDSWADPLARYLPDPPAQVGKRDRPMLTGSDPT